MTDLLQEAGVKTVVVSELGPRVAWRQDLVALRRLIRLCHAFQPDIIHTHTAKAGALGRLAALTYRARGARRCRVVHTFHGHVFEHYFGPWTSRAVRLVERFLAHVTDRIVVLSPRQRTDIVERFRIAPARKVQIIPLGLDLEALLPEGPSPLRAELQYAPGVPLVGIVGRLVPIKNHELFLETARRLIERGIAAGFVIVGGGDREPALREIAKRCGIDAHVRFLGWRRDLADIYRSLDVVALTSRNEGTPVALIEAMAAERAVVATRIGGVEDVIESEKTGLLIQADNIEELASAITRLLADQALRARLGKAARTAVLAKYSKARLLAETTKMYRELMDGV